jgi:hypothetical protein
LRIRSYAENKAGVFSGISWVPLLVSIGDNFFANFAKECTQDFQGSLELQQAMKAFGLHQRHGLKDSGESGPCR